MPVRHLYFVRHGQYFTDPKQETHGSLTSLGQRQASRLAKRLSQGPTFDVVYSSDAPRAVQTAEIVLAKLDQVPWKKTRSLREGLPSMAPHWPKEMRPSSKELKATQFRMRRAFDKHFQPTRPKDRHELFIVHGNLIRYLTRLALGDPPAHWWKMAIHNCSLTSFAVARPPLGRTLIQFGDVGHLPTKMQTFG